MREKISGVFDKDEIKQIDFTEVGRRAGFEGGKVRVVDCQSVFSICGGRWAVKLVGNT
jgi:hypothetical protein